MVQKNMFPKRSHIKNQGDLSPRSLPVINQAMLYSIFKQVPAILCVLKGPELIFEFANGSYESWSGKNNLIHKKLGDVLPELEEQGLVSIVHEIYKTGKAYTASAEPIYLYDENRRKEFYYLDFNIQLYFNKAEDEKRIMLFAYDVTETVKTRQMIADAEQKFRQLFFGIPTPMYTYDQSGKILLYNDALTNLCGCEPDLEKDQWCPVRNIYLPGEKLIPRSEWPFANFNDVFESGKELILELHDGTRKNVISYPDRIWDEQGQVSVYINSLVDISARVKAVKELEDAAKIIESLFLNAPSFICILSGPDHIYELVNPEFNRLFGEVNRKGHELAKVAPELIEQGVIEKLDTVYKTGQPYVGTQRRFYFKINGNPKQFFYLNFSFQPIHDSRNSITGVFIFGYDVTDLVLERQKGEENLKKILEALPQITSISSEYGTDIYFNKYFYEYSGLSKEEATVNGWNSILDPGERNAFLAEWEKCKAANKDFVAEIKLRRQSDNMFRWHIASLTAVKNSRGKVVNWVASAVDIHEQKSKEDKKDEFLSIASHELKTPLTAIKAYLQLLDMSLGKYDQELKSFAEKAIISVDRLKDLISELLDVSKIQQNKLNIQCSPFHFSKMVHDVIESLQYNCHTHRIITNLDEVGEVNADRERIVQVINNLVSNAVKYSPSADQVVVNLEDREDHVQVSVQDFGIGISTPNLEKVFERYFRVDDHDIHFQGLGIGLYISMEIIKMHEGRLWTESSIGKGSIFYFSIPKNI